MAALTSVVAGITALAGIGTSIAQADMAAGSASAARKQAKEQSDAQSARQDALLAEEKQRESDEAVATAATDARSMARSRQKMMASGAQGRRDTILTSPLGISGGDNGYGGGASARKTLLGQ